MGIRLPLAAVVTLFAAQLQQPPSRAPTDKQRQELHTAIETCRAEKLALGTAMAAVFSDFAAVPAPVPIDVLVAIDGRIRALLAWRPRYQPCESDGKLIYDKRWERIGVGLGHWGDNLAYTGSLLVAAHRQNPRSARAYTLYSTVFGEVPAHGAGIMPNIKAAFAYESEFPHGPFIRDVYETIADFHKDLYMVLRDKLTDFKYECFAPYISAGPRPAQEARARSVAIDYYERILRLAPGDGTVRQFLAETRVGTVNGWSFCAD